MKFKKPSKEDMPIVIASAIIVLMMMVMSATSPTETGGKLTLGQWASVNLVIILFAVIIDASIIKSREKKRKESEITKEKERARQERAKNEMTVAVNIKSGAIGITGICQIHQLFENNLFYFDDEVETLYEMVGYEWDGSKYKKVIQTSSKGMDTGKTKASGVVAGGFGMAGAIGNTKSVSNRQDNGETTEKEVEEQGSAIIRMKRVQDGRIVSFVIECDSEVDKKIRCFNNVPE